MNVDEVAGHVFPAREFVPEEVLGVAQFARVIGSPNRVYYSTAAAREAGFAARPLPQSMLAFLQTIDEADLTDILGIKYGKTLAAGAEHVFEHTPTEHDRIIGQSWVDTAYEKAGRDGMVRQFLVLTTEFRLKATDALISRSTITFVERVD